HGEERSASLAPGVAVPAGRRRPARGRVAVDEPGLEPVSRERTTRPSAPAPEGGPQGRDPPSRTCAATANFAAFSRVRLSVRLASAPGPLFRSRPVTSLPLADSFVPRHLGPSDADVRDMLATLGYTTLDALVQATIPAGIRMGRPLALPPAMSEQDALAAFRQLMSPNEVWRSFIGLCYATTHVPAVIPRN